MPVKMPAIVGLVRHQPSGKPIPGARVRAYDRDDQTNDLIGEAVTAAEGGFEIAGDDAAFAEFVEDSPDVVIDVELPNGRTLSARRDLRWSAGKLLPVAAIDVPAEIVEAPREPERGKGKKEKGRDKHEKGEGKKEEPRPRRQWRRPRPSTGTLRMVRSLPRPARSLSSSEAARAVPRHLPED